MSRCGMILVVLLSYATSAVASGAGGHADPVAPVLLALIVILVVAKLGSEIFERLGQPAVLGELLGGVVLGNLILLNPAWDFFEPLRAAHIQENWAIVIDNLARLGVLEKGLDRLTVGVGMIPRGEVGLIFASIGKGLQVIDDATFSAVVIMVIVTTLVTPPVLKLTLARGEEK